jgi:cytosine/uracil/thiamine/allantoin permease
VSHSHCSCSSEPYRGLAEEACIAFVSILVTSATVVVYHVQIWDPVQLTTKFSSSVVVVIGLVMVILATMSVNVAANVVSPSYDFSNAAPKLVSFRIGGLIRSQNSESAASADASTSASSTGVT